MLVELHISGLGVIDDVTLSLSPGLNVLTGETGAGKTLVIDGLALVLGRRARPGLAREGAERSGVEARFTAADVASARQWAEDGELVLARSLSAEGRSSARVGGQLAPASALTALGADLVEVHGQHQAQRLLSPTAQLAFLDRFCGADHAATVARYREVYARLREARARLERLDEEAREREREKSLLAYQIREIESAALRVGERAELEAEESRLAHAERILERLARALSVLTEEGAGVDALSEAAAAAREAAEADRDAGGLARRLASLAEEARDAAEDARRRAESVHLDPDRLGTVRERLAAIRDLERKYGEGEAEVLAFGERARARLVSLERAGEERAELEAEASSLSERLSALAGTVTGGRRKAAPRLSSALRAELGELGMEGSSIEVALEDRETGPDGAEDARIVFSGGPGQPLRALSKVASGGELSRTMLALRSVMADLEGMGTVVFDEVDAGIGGRAGIAVGRRLARLAATRQVLVVTHLPQIACFGDRHFRVTKRGGSAAVEALDEDERVAELARMLSGMPTEEAAAHAEQLLAEASSEKAGSSAAGRAASRSGTLMG